METDTLKEKIIMADLMKKRTKVEEKRTMAEVEDLRIIDRQERIISLEEDIMVKKEEWDELN